MQARRQIHLLVFLLVLFAGIGILNLFLSGGVSTILFSSGFATSGSGVGQVCVGVSAPILNTIPDQTATEGILFQYTVNATQATGKLINYTDNTTLFVIGLNTGLISFIPQGIDVGTHSILINATTAVNCPNVGGVNESFTLTIVSVPPSLGKPKQDPPRPPVYILPPPYTQTVLSIPYRVLDIRKIVIEGTVVYDQFKNIRSKEYVINSNTLTTIEISVRNIGHIELSNVHLNIPLPEGVRLISINPPNVAELMQNEDYTFIVQIETGEQAFDFVIEAKSDQASDFEVIPLATRATFESPIFGFEVPPWIPLFIAIPLLFFLGYSILQNKEFIIQFLRDFFFTLLGWLYRRTYFIDEDMLRKLIKSKKLNKMLHLWTVPDVHARYHNEIKNLRTMELKKEQYDDIAKIIRQYAIGGEMGTLIVMTKEKPKPRIMTSFMLSKKLHEDFKRITFYDPIQKEIRIIILPIQDNLWCQRRSCPGIHHISFWL